jgi:hypothetical protein
VFSSSTIRPTRTRYKKALGFPSLSHYESLTSPADNAIPIEGWYDDPRDRELLCMLPLLHALRDSHDVRPLLLHWRMRNGLPL